MSSSKFWLGIRNECDRPRSGVVNQIRLYSKLEFGKLLSKHKCDVIHKHSEKISQEPNMVWKLLKRKSSIIKPETTPPDEHDGLSHFTAELSHPVPGLENKFNRELDKCFMLCRSRYSFVAGITNLVCSILKLKKKKSKGF